MRGVERARIVIVAAGSLGSTELLLRSRDEHRTLPALSRFLGEHWSSNGDFLTPAIHEQPTGPTIGPTISGAIDFLDGSRSGEVFWIQDGGFPDIMDECLRGSMAPAAAIHWIQQLLGRVQATRHVMPWFAQGVDRNLYVADGAIVPEAIGVNPSRTIGALSERIAGRIVAEGR